MKRGFSAESPKASRALLIALLKAVIEVHDRLRPKSFAKFLPDHQFSRFFQQHGQQLERLFLQPDPFAKFRELTRSKVGFENPKLETPERYGLLHGKPDRSESSSACRVANPN
jgi:hypothetical protein